MEECQTEGDDLPTVSYHADFGAENQIRDDGISYLIALLMKVQLCRDSGVVFFLVFTVALCLNIVPKHW